jgi:phosphoribosylformimino-5-aminoimidazole carboxamide ribotide isomerase
VLAQDIFKVIHLIKTFGSIFIGSLDIKDDHLHISGWQEEEDIKIEAFLKHIKTVDLCSIEYTNIKKDGMLTGPDIEYSKVIADAVEMPVVISGGVGSLADVEKIMKIEHSNIVGLILGKAIFEGLIDLKEALQKFPSPDTSAKSFFNLCNVPSVFLV